MKRFLWSLFFFCLCLVFLFIVQIVVYGQSFPSDAKTLSGIFNPTYETQYIDLLSSLPSDITILYSTVTPYSKKDITSGQNLGVEIGCWAYYSMTAQNYAFFEEFDSNGTFNRTNASHEVWTNQVCAASGDVRLLVDTSDSDIFESGLILWYSVTYVERNLQTESTSTPMVIQNPTQDYAVGIILFFITFFSLLFYFRKGGE